MINFKHAFSISLLSFIVCQLMAQNNGVLVEFEGQGLGILIPRMTTSEMNGIGKPAEGLMVYNSTDHVFNFYNGNSWQTFNTGPIGPQGVSIIEITSTDIGGGMFELEFLMSDMSTHTVTTPDLRGSQGPEGAPGPPGPPGLGIPQMLSKSGDQITLSDGGGTVTINDADSSASNEIQQLETNGDTIFITGGNYIVLPGLSFLSDLIPSVQERLDQGETPCQIYNNGNGYPIDSLYGKIWAGGFIFYFDTNNCTGLVAATMNIPADDWGCLNTFIGGTSPSIGTGAANTALIVNGCGEASFAAKGCNDLVHNGYDDWFLPSVNEMREMYFKIGNGAPPPNTDIGGLQNNFYWTSTETNAELAWIRDFLFDFQNGGQFKNTVDWIRPARQF